MPLQRRVDELTFSGGLKQKEHPWLQQEGFLALVNCVQDKDGAVAKLPGYELVGTDLYDSGEDDVPYALTGGGKLVAIRDQLGLVDDGKLYALHAAAGGGDQWTPCGIVSPWVAEQRPLVQLPEDPTYGPQNRHDCCRVGDWLYTVAEFWFPGSAQSDLGIVCMYLPTREIRYVKSGLALAITNPRVLPWNDGESAVVLYSDDGDLKYRKITPESVGSAVVLTTDDYGAVFDVAAGNSRIYVAGRLTGTGVVVRSYTIGASTLTLDQDVTFDTIVGDIHAVAIAVGTRVCIAWQAEDAGDQVVEVAAQNLALSAVVWDPVAVYTATLPDATNEARILQLAIVETSSGTGNSNYVVFSDPSDDYFEPTIRAAWVGHSGTTGVLRGTDTCGFHRLRSRPWIDGDRVCVLAEQALDLAHELPYYVVLGSWNVATPGNRMLPHAQVGHFRQPRFAGKDFDDVGYWRMSTPYQDAEGSWNVQSIEASSGGANARIVEYRFVRDDRVGKFAVLGQQAYIVGGFLSAWDGSTAREAAFLHAPKFSADAVAGGDLTAGTRSYKITYSRVGASGEITRSRPSFGLDVTHAADEQTELEIRPYTLSTQDDAHGRHNIVEIWRTKAGEASPFWLVGRFFQNPDTRVLLSFTDNVLDSSAPGEFGESLYTDGQADQELANDPPLSPLAIGSWRNRIWVTDGAEIQYSKEGVANRSAEFAGVQSLPRTLAQPITGIAPLGDAMAVFTPDSTAYVYGDGPAPNGSGSTLVGPVPVHGELGCVHPGGLTPFQAGVLVPTRKGLHLLTTGREYQDIGAGIEDLLAVAPRIRDGDAEVGTDLVWLALANDAGTSGFFVIWDQRHQTWSYAFAAGAGGSKPSSVRSVGDEHYWVESGVADCVHRRTPGAYLLRDEAYYQELITFWTKASGHVGEMRFRRMWLLGEFGDQDPENESNGLVVQIDRDFGPNVEQRAFSAAGLATAQHADDVMLLRMMPARQRCTAFRVQIREDNNDLPSAGFVLVALRFETAARATGGALVSRVNSGDAG